MENKYFAELARRLRAAGITAGHPEKNRLTVLLNNQPVLSVSAGSDVFLLPAGSNNMEASELYHRVAQTADEVYAYQDSDTSEKRLGVTKDGIATVDLVHFQNGEQHFFTDHEKLESFRSDPVVAEAVERLHQQFDQPDIGIRMGGI